MITTRNLVTCWGVVVASMFVGPSCDSNRRQIENSDRLGTLCNVERFNAQTQYQDISVGIYAPPLHYSENRVLNREFVIGDALSFEVDQDFKYWGSDNRTNSIIYRYHNVLPSRYERSDNKLPENEPYGTRLFRELSDDGFLSVIDLVQILTIDQARCPARLQCEDMLPPTNQETYILIGRGMYESDLSVLYVEDDQLRSVAISGVIGRETYVFVMDELTDRSMIVGRILNSMMNSDSHDVVVCRLRVQ